MYKKIIYWFLYGVVASVLPWISSVVIYKLAGYNVQIEKSMPEILMITAGVAMSAISSESNIEKKIEKEKNKDKKTITKKYMENLAFTCRILSMASLIFSWFFYVGVYNNWGTIAPRYLNDISEENTRIVLHISFAIFIVNIVMGIYMELQDKEDDEKIEEKNVQASIEEMK